MLHHPVKATLDVVAISMSVGAIGIDFSNYFTYLLAIPSFIWGLINLIEWYQQKRKK